MKRGRPAREGVPLIKYDFFRQAEGPPKAAPTFSFLNLSNFLKIDLRVALAQLQFAKKNGRHSSPVFIVMLFSQYEAHKG